MITEDLCKYYSWIRPWPTSYQCNNGIVNSDISLINVQTLIYCVHKQLWLVPTRVKWITNCDRGAQLR